MKICTVVLFVLASILWGQPKAQWVEGDAIVKFKKGQEAKALGEIRGLLNADMIRPIGGAGAYLVRSRGLSTAAMVQVLKVRKDVVYAEPNALSFPLAATPNDPCFPWSPANGNPPCNYNDQVTLAPYGSYYFGSALVAGISAEAAWDVTTGTANVIVGILEPDTFQFDHPDLADNVWSAPQSFQAYIGQGYEGSYYLSCPQGSHGFVAALKSPVNGSYSIPGSCTNADLLYSASADFHATGTAGIIGAKGNNSTGGAGINWTTRLMALAEPDAYVGVYPPGSDAAGVIDAIEFAIQAKIAGANVRVISGNGAPVGPYAALQDEVVRAGSYDILIVVPANNASVNLEDPGNANFPTCYNAIQVADANAIGSLDSESDWGPTIVHIAAPSRGFTTDVSSSYQVFGGTCGATAHVAGTAALALARKSMDVNALKAAILDSTKYDSGISSKVLVDALNSSQYDRGAHLSASKAVNSHASSNPFFVYLDYFDLFGRNPDRSGLSYWVGQLDGSVTKQAVAQGFLTSSEFKNGGGFIIAAYRALFGAYPGGYQSDWWYWMQQFQLGTSQEGLIDTYTGSMSNADFVSLVLSHVTPSSGDAAYWTNYLNSNTRAAMILDDRFWTPMYNGVMVAAMYLGFFHSPGDSGGIAYWKGQLDASVPLTDVIGAFISSTTYTNRYF